MERIRYCSIMANQVEIDYKNKQLAWKSRIRMNGNRKRDWLKYYLLFPFVWIIHNIRDWRTAVIFVIVLLLISSEVWVPYLLALIFWNNEGWRIGLLSFASACWLFWLGPGTPFLVICISITIAVKALFNKIRDRGKNK